MLQQHNEEEKMHQGCVTDVSGQKWLSSCPWQPDVDHFQPLCVVWLTLFTPTFVPKTKRKNTLYQVFHFYCTIICSGKWQFNKINQVWKNIIGQYIRIINSLLTSYYKSSISKTYCQIVLFYYLIGIQRSVHLMTYSALYWRNRSFYKQ